MLVCLVVFGNGDCVCSLLGMLLLNCLVSECCCGLLVGCDLWFCCLGCWMFVCGVACVVVLACVFSFWVFGVCCVVIYGC